MRRLLAFGEAVQVLSSEHILLLPLADIEILLLSLVYVLIKVNDRIATVITAALRAVILFVLESVRALP